MKKAKFLLDAICAVVLLLSSCNNDSEIVMESNLKSNVSFLTQNSPSVVYVNDSPVLRFENSEALLVAVDGINVMTYERLSEYCGSIGWMNHCLQSHIVYDSVISVIAEKHGIRPEVFDQTPQETMDLIFTEIKSILLSEYSDYVYFGTDPVGDDKDNIISPIGNLDTDVFFSDNGMLIIGNELIVKTDKTYNTINLDLTQQNNNQISVDLSQTTTPTVQSAPTRIASVATTSTLSPTYGFIKTGTTENGTYKLTVEIETEPSYSSFYSREDISTTSTVKNYKKWASSFWLTEFPTTVNIDYTYKYIRTNGVILQQRVAPVYPASFSHHDVQFTVSYSDQESAMQFSSYGISTYTIDVDNGRVRITESM